MRRVDGHGRVDRSAPLAFTFDGAPLTGFRGDTLASALLANGVDVVGTSIHRGRPRGISAAGAEEPNGLVQVELGGGSEPMLRATEVELFDGLAARGLPGRGALDAPRRRDLRPHLRALRRAGRRRRAGRPGRRLRGERDRRAGDPRRVGAGAVAARVRRPRRRCATRASGSRSRRRRGCCCARPRSAPTTRATSCSPSAAPTISAATPPPGVSRERLWHVRARQVVLATGAHERPIAFAGNDLPGVMLAGAAREYLERFGVARRVARRAAHHERRRATRPPQCSPPRASRSPRSSTRARATARCRTAPSTWPAAVVSAAEGERRVTAAVVGDRAIACDLLLVSGGWSPAVHLLSQAQGTRALGRGRRRVRARRRAGRLARRGRRRRARTTTTPASRRAPPPARGAAATGFGSPNGAAAALHEPAAEPATLLWAVPPPAGRSEDDCFVDQQRDATVADLRRAAAAGLRSPEHVKRFTDDRHRERPGQDVRRRSRSA